MNHLKLLFLSTLLGIMILGSMLFFANESARAGQSIGPTPAPTATPGLPTNSWNQSYPQLAQPLQTKEQVLDQVLYYDSKTAVWEQPWSLQTLTTEPSRITIEWHSDRSYDGNYYGPGTETGPVWVVTIKGKGRATLPSMRADPNFAYGYIAYTIAQKTGDLLKVSPGP